MNNKLSFRDVMIPDILSKVILFAGSITPFNKSLKTNINKWVILKDWLTQIRLQTAFEDIDVAQLPLLWILYQKRVNNLPSNLLDKAIANGLDKYLFYYRQYEYSGNLAILDQLLMYGFTTLILLQINMELSDFINFNKVRKGDLVHLSVLGSYRNEGILIYNGQELMDLDYQSDDYGSIPSSICINDFPIVTYFKDDENNQGAVYFDTQGTQLKQEDIYTIGKDLVYTYITIGKSPGYRIWTQDSTIISRWSKIIIFETGEARIFSLSGDWFNLIHNNIKNYHNELFDFF